ncbi:hypothetical protein [Legionella sainthelensi]|uniref:hypothetical protein n=1 Tax=Legionella sainthelensi TaxID=28087 RepID=UPI001FD31346|nr:hypothetical protein [Legionella sainthelensi]
MRYRMRNLGDMSGEKIAQAFATIPQGVSTFDLSDNDIYQKSGAELAQAFVALPQGVTTLDLRNNQFEKKAQKN